MDTSCHSQFKRQEGKVQTWHPTEVGGGGVLSLCLNKETAKKAAESLHDGVDQAKAARWTEEANDGMAKTMRRSLHLDPGP